MKEKELVQFLELSKETRLTNEEVDPFLDSCADANFVLKFHFVSRSLSFGNQKDPKYNDGHAVTCEIDGLDIECSLLFTAGDNDQAEALEVGNVFTSNVHVLDYDSLYKRIIFGNKGPLEVLDPFDVNESKSVPKHDADRTDSIEESQEEAPRESLDQVPDPPRPPQRALVPRGATPVILNENEEVVNIETSDPPLSPQSPLVPQRAASAILNENEEVDESVEVLAVPSNESLIYTQSSAGAGCVSGFFFIIGFIITLIGLRGGGAFGTIPGLILLGIGIAIKYTDSEGKDYSLKKSLAKRSGDNNSKSNKETNWSLLYAFYVVGAFLLFIGIKEKDMILVLIALVVIGIGIAYRKATYDRGKVSFLNLFWPYS